MNAINLVINHFGTPTKLAKALDVRPQIVNNWRHRGIPASRVKQISKASGGVLKIEDLLN